MTTPAIREAAAALAGAALRQVQEPTTGRVRVEDYLTVLTAATGEAAIVASGVSVMPLQVAFEIRPAVEAAGASADLPVARRHLLCGVALAEALRQVQGAIDMQVALTLALEVVFGMTKMVPMSNRAFEAATREGASPA